MTKNRETRKRLWALLLSAALIVTQLPAVAMAENHAPEDGSIASFEELPSGVADQTVDVGTELSGLNLPDTVTASVYHVTEDMVIPDEDDSDGDSTEESDDPTTASPSDAENRVSEGNAGDSSVKDSGKVVTSVTTSEEEIPVTWDSEPAYDGDAEGKYVFMADVDGYTLSGSAKLPQITVTVAADTVEKPTESQPGEPISCTQTEGCTLPDGHEGDCVPAPPSNDSLVKTITGWTFVDDENLNEGVLPLINVCMEQQADFDTVVSMLPKQISGSIEGEADPATVNITKWACPEYIQDGDDNWPLTGEHTFTAALPEGYACEPFPTVKVLLGGAELYASAGDFTVTGGELNSDYTYSNNTLTINTSTPMTISGITSTDKILVPNGVTANVTLSSVTINVSRTYEACAFTVEAGGRANITLQGTNAMASGTNRAGLEVPENATVAIDGNGSLTVEGGTGGAGIGGSIVSGGNIIISGGTVKAKGGNRGAGIGGGSGHGNGGNITISGGTVEARGGSGGAGIGGGSGGSGGNITISGGTVEASGDGGGAGIGGGNGYSGGGGGGNITISGGTVNANGAPGGGAGIGGGTYGSGGTVKISGAGTKVTATSISGCDVGSGAKDKNDNSGSLSVTDGATLEMKSIGTNVDTPEYKNCTIIDKDGNGTAYNENGEGKPIAFPTLSLEASPAGSVVLPNTVTLTATLTDAYPDNAGKTITFTVNNETHTETTDSSGMAVYTITNPPQGTYMFGASFAGDGDNKRASATGITGYTVALGTQAALGITGLDSAYTYGCEAFSLSTSGGSGSGAVDFLSSEPSIASVTGNTVTIQKAGTFTITATKASDSHYAEAKVTSHAVTVHSATPNMSLTASGGSTTSDPLTLTATVSKVGSGVTPAGTVTFKVGDKTLHSDSLDGDGNAVYTISNPEAGSHVYTVEYSGQTGYYNKTSTARTIGVGLTDQTGFTITDPGEKTYGDGNFTLTASGGQSTGGVSFSVTSGNGVLAVAADGSVKITGAGKVMVTALKDGDSKYNQATATLEITVKPRDISNVTVNVMGSHVYTGSQLQPGFEVYDGGNAITTGDYTNSYGTNMTVGTGAGSITLTGQRNYTGTKTVQFDIEKRSLNSAVITLEASSYPYTGSEIKPAVTNVVVDGITVPAAEYDVGYSANKDAGTATVTITAKADGNFSGSASTTFTITKADTPSGGGGSSGGGSSYSEPEPQSSYTVAGDNISRTISRNDLKKLADSGKSLTLRCDKASMTFEPAALKAILAAVPATAGNITFSAAPSDLSAFPDAAKLIGNRPVYDFTISYKDSKGNPVVVPVNFPAGSASISINYTPAAAEVTGSLFMVYVDGKGAVTWLDKSSYDNRKVLAEVPHFSVYGVAYKAPVPVFTDIANHWAKADMEFVAARGLLSGTGEKVFSPDAAMTRGMFVTALGRLAGVNPASYQTRSFTDVKTDAYYAAYVEWAAQKNIVKGTGEGLFSPDAPVTREQMAVMMTNYAGQMGYSIPTPLAAVTFADNESISTWAAKEVAAMQRAGIIKGKDGNRFDPQASATRAEVSAVLRRFVEIVIDPATATGWVKNDSGHWLYYQNGKTLTGWQTIGKLRYFFNSDGVMHEGWKQDTGTNKWYYWTNAGAATGWRKLGVKWYYFDENGIMAVNTKINGYEIGPDGARKE